MFEAHDMLYLYVETPLHAGMGSTVGVVDLPIQRERITHYPCVPGSGLKGALRAEAELAGADANGVGVADVFGPETANASDHAGAVSFGDARLLLFPVRSLCGVFVWTTSVAVLSRYARDLTAVGIKGFPVIPPAPGTSKTSASNWGAISAGDKAVLEEYCFTHHVEGDDATRLIAEWLAEYALPATDEYAHFRTELQRRLVVLSEDEFRDFTQFATEVVTRVHLDAETKTVMSGQLWTEEMLPAETLLYAPLHFTKGRPKNDKKPSGKEIATALRKMSPDRLQLGGDETVGRGIVCLRYASGKEQAS